jgi:hypothetical protein
MAQNSANPSSDITICDNDPQEDTVLQLSQESAISVLLDGPPTKRPRLWGNGPSLTERIHNVLDALKSNGFSSPVDFLLPIFYGSEDLRNDARAKGFRRSFNNHKDLKLLLWNQYNPPRKTTKGARASLGNEKFGCWAFEVVESVLRKELVSLGESLHLDSRLVNVSEDADLHSLNDSVLLDMQSRSPKLLNLLSKISAPFSGGNKEVKDESRVSS